MHRRRLLDHPAGNLVNTGDARLLAFASNSKRRRKSSTLVGKHVPDSDPGSIPAPAGDTNHRRPNNDCRGSQEKCSAGACPQLGVEWGAQMTPEPFHQPMHPIFMPWCAGAAGMDDWYENARHRIRHSGDESMPRTPGAGIQRGRVAPTTPNHFQRPSLIFIPWCAGGGRHGRLVPRHSDPGSIPAPAGDANHRRPNNDCRGSQEKCSAGACPQLGVGWGAQMTPEPFHQPMHPIFMPWCAGGGRHGRLVQKHVPDSDPGAIPAPAGDANHRRPNNDCRGSQEKCSAGACP